MNDGRFASQELLRDMKNNADFGDSVIGPELRKQTKVLNLGCGFVKIENAVNVDKIAMCDPDILWDIDIMPWPFDDNSFDVIYMDHVLEHLINWWGALREASRVLRVGGDLLVFVPDQTNSHAMAYRDHLHVFTIASFQNFSDGSCSRTGTNAYVKDEIVTNGTIPLIIKYYRRVPFPKYAWMQKWPWLLKFCANHMINFIDEQHVGFRKIQTEDRK